MVAPTRLDQFGERYRLGLYYQEKAMADDDYDTCVYHPDVIAAHLVRVNLPTGTVRWLPACTGCADEFDSGDVKPWA